MDNYPVTLEVKKSANELFKDTYKEAAIHLEESVNRTKDLEEVITKDNQIILTVFQLFILFFILLASERNIKFKRR